MVTKGGVRQGVLAHDIAQDDEEMRFDPPGFDVKFRRCAYVAQIVGERQDDSEIIWNTHEGIRRAQGGTSRRNWPAGSRVQIIGIADPHPGDCLDPRGESDE
jgi:hypothetical protein